MSFVHLRKEAARLSNSFTYDWGLALCSEALENELRSIFLVEGARARKFPDISFMEIEGL